MAMGCTHTYLEQTSSPLFGYSDFIPQLISSGAIFIGRQEASASQIPLETRIVILFPALRYPSPLAWRDLSL